MSAARHRDIVKFRRLVRKPAWILSFSTLDHEVYSFSAKMFDLKRHGRRTLVGQ